MKTCSAISRHKMILFGTRTKNGEIGLIPIPKLTPNSIMLSRLFHAHGQMCASHPWEVIITSLTVTVCLVSMSIYTSHGMDKICGWNYICHSEEDLKSSDIIVLAITRCLAVMYIYLQFRNLRRLGSKYLLGIAGVFTIFSSFVFSIAFINLIGSDLKGLNEALPFFLLLVDLGKASALARYSFSSTTQDEMQTNIARGMAIIGPAITLDAIVETLVIGVGTLSGVRQLETMCCFGCLSVIANYLAFMTFYPSCLALILEVSRERNQGKSLKHLQQLAKVLQAEEEEKKPNPVTQRVKIIMSAGLVMVHAHSRLIADNMSGSGIDGESTVDSASIMSPNNLHDQRIKPDIPLWQFYLESMLTKNLDYSITLLLAIVLIIKYMLFDIDVDQMHNLLAKEEKPHGSTDESESSVGSTIEILGKEEASPPEAEQENDSIPPPKHKLGVLFSIGDDSGSETETDDKETQTEVSSLQQVSVSDSEPRDLETCLEILKSEEGPQKLTDAEIIILVEKKHIPAYKLEKTLDNYERGISIRRQMLLNQLPTPTALKNLPYNNYDYKYVDGACCENVIGYMPVPVGFAGPLLLDNKRYIVPMATTEGCLVASTNRGCRALEQSGGIQSSVYRDGMTRGPVVQFPTAKRACEALCWLEDKDNFERVKEWFDTTSRFARLQKLSLSLAGRLLFIRFVAKTGDAMGMNMLSKGSEKALTELREEFPDMEIISLSGNYCTDKKPAAINWVEGRGRSVVCEATVSGKIIRSLLKTTTASLVKLNMDKNLVGSAMAGSIGGFNAHAANIVTAIYIATGQDAAQNISSSNCIMQMEPTGLTGEDLYITCTMPSLELGTIGGGTILPPQAACLEMLGVRGSKTESPGENAKQLARIVCGTVMAGELSLMSALAAGHLVQSHMRHNRSTLNFSPSFIKPAVAQAEPGTCTQQSS